MDSYPYYSTYVKYPESRAFALRVHAVSPSPVIVGTDICVCFPSNSGTVNRASELLVCYELSNNIINRRVFPELVAHVVLEAERHIIQV